MRVGENCLQAAEGAKKLLMPLPKPELSVVRISSLLSLREPRGEPGFSDAGVGEVRE